MSITGLIDKTFRPYKGAVYRLGMAMPEPEYETATGRRLFTVTQMEKIAALAAEAEREACAKLADSMSTFGLPPDVGSAIRMRSNAKVSGVPPTDATKGG